MKPNILLLFPDQWRPGWLGGLSEELPLRTPVLKRLSEEGMRFTRVFSPSPLCAPARAALATGLKYHRAGVRDNRDNLPLGLTTFYQRLRDSGYAVLGCGKFDLHKPGFIWGEEGKNLLQAWGFSDGIDSEGKIDGVAAYRRSTPGPYLSALQRRGLAAEYANEMENRGTRGTDPTLLPQKLYGDDWVAQNGINLISNTAEGQPWFLQVNFPGPHLPFDITKDMKSHHEGSDFPPPFDNEDKSVDHIGIRRNYAAMIENIDRLVGSFEQFLKERGDWENTLVIFSSDHGEMLGDRGHFGKCLPYRSSAEIPLIVYGPGVKGASVNDSPVELIDLAATILDFAGLETDKNWDSRSLKSVLEGRTDRVREIAVSSLCAQDHPNAVWRLVADDQYKLVEWENGRLELYHKDDPFEQNDLSAGKKEIAEKMKEALPPRYESYSFSNDK